MDRSTHPASTTPLAPAPSSSRSRLHRRGLPAALPAAALAAAAVLGLNAPTLAQPPATLDERTRAAIDHAEALSTAFEHAAEIIRPSLVNVSSVARLRTAADSPQRRSAPDPFRDFFGDDWPFGPSGPGMPQQPRERRGQGSGFIVSTDGYIVTNNHVVDGATEVTVRLHDDRSLTAQVVGTDPQTDIAVLKIDADNLTPAAFGRSESLRIGQWVIAAGDPLGLSSSITAGIISATGRSRMGITAYEDFIQTDAAINPGNSGGPLVNLRGEVVGINTAIATRTGGFMGIGFAIPESLARPIIESLIETGQVTRGYLGVNIQDLSDELAQSFNYQGRDGALVADVLPDSPADRAGLRRGDIITKLDDWNVENTDQLRLRIAQLKPGTNVALEIFRDGRTRELSVNIGSLDDADTLARNTGPARNQTLGVTVEELTPELARQLGLRPDRARGVVVTEVEPRSPAAQVGLRTGDLILAVGENAVDSPDDFRRAMADVDLQQDGVRLVVSSRGVTRYVFIRTR